MGRPNRGKPKHRYGRTPPGYGKKKVAKAKPILRVPQPVVVKAVVVATLTAEQLDKLYPPTKHVLEQRARKAHDVARMRASIQPK